MILQFEKEITEDGSPTVRLFPTMEPMHALDGAFTETLYIYQPTVEQALRQQEPALFSLGLGLAYNEILIACESLKAGIEPAKVYSYEFHPDLIKGFRLWIAGQDHPLHEIHNEISSRYETQYQFTQEQIRQQLQKWLESHTLELLGPVEESMDIPACHGILFDAFSGKTSPELWNEAFLERFFSATAQPCFVSTYASKGALRRALQKNGFVVDLRKGFGKKRESTFAQKN